MSRDDDVRFWTKDELSEYLESHRKSCGGVSDRELLEQVVDFLVDQEARYPGIHEALMDHLVDYVPATRSL